MKKIFNVDGICFPDENYMVNLDGRLKEIKELVEQGKYFVINRARQYGKTTTIRMLAKKLASEFVVFSISFEGFGDIVYENEYTFCRRFCGLLYDVVYYGEAVGIPEELVQRLHTMSMADSNTDFRDLSNFISKLCMEAEKPIVLIIDEVDQASNQEVFLSFLGTLRDKYLKRKNRPAFQSVILAGVYDIKNLKLKIRKEKEHQYNSPWNIAAAFSVDMSFSVEDIAGMLSDYEKENRISMDIHAMAERIYQYTMGYPYLVSAICKIIDEQIAEKKGFADKSETWSEEGVLEAVRELLKSANTLFDDMVKHLLEYPELSKMLQNILFNGQYYPYNRYNQEINIGEMFGFIVDNDGKTAVANRIFETHLYNYFISEEMSKNTIRRIDTSDINQFVQNGSLDMDLVMEKFVEYFMDLYDVNDEKFIEEYGRKIFLLYLKPIINGTGNYYIEARTRDKHRTDVIVDYHGEQYVIEMKIWHGEEYNRRGEEQLAGYLEEYHLKKGYLLSFNFNKKKQAGVYQVKCGDKMLIEVVV